MFDAYLAYLWCELECLILFIWTSATPIPRPLEDNAKNTVFFSMKNEAGKTWQSPSFLRFSFQMMLVFKLWFLPGNRTINNELLVNQMISNFLANPQIIQMNMFLEKRTTILSQGSPPWSVFVGQLTKRQLACVFFIPFFRRKKHIWHMCVHSFLARKKQSQHTPPRLLATLFFQKHRAAVVVHHVENHLPSRLNLHLFSRKTRVEPCHCGGGTKWHRVFLSGLKQQTNLLK